MCRCIIGVPDQLEMLLLWIVEFKLCFYCSCYTVFSNMEGSATSGNRTNPHADKNCWKRELLLLNSWAVITKLWWYLQAHDFLFQFGYKKKILPFICYFLNHFFYKSDSKLHNRDRLQSRPPLQMIGPGAWAGIFWGWVSSFRVQLPEPSLKVKALQSARVWHSLWQSQTEGSVVDWMSVPSSVTMSKHRKAAIKEERERRLDKKKRYVGAK